MERVNPGNDSSRQPIWIKSSLLDCHLPPVAREEGNTLVNIEGLRRFSSSGSLASSNSATFRKTRGEERWGWVRGYAEPLSCSPIPSVDNSLRESSLLETANNVSFGHRRLRQISPLSSYLQQERNLPPTKLQKRSVHQRDHGQQSALHPRRVTVCDPGHPHNNSSLIISLEEWKQSVLQANNSWRTKLGREEIPPNDLIQLTHLHEPAVVDSLRTRYNAGIVYTNTGPILLALNPFCDITSLYSEERMKEYFTRGALGEQEKLDPHVYSVADCAFRSMMFCFQNSVGHDSNSADQSILVSGESGAGKTVTTKIVMRYLTAISQRFTNKTNDLSTNTAENHRDIEQQVLQSNPILESFGNARTVRNDNSSRFGKFIEMQFRSGGGTAGRCILTGASIQTYLLEKVRLINQAQGERNYHIFYELLNGCSNKNRKEAREFQIDEASVYDFRMTSGSGTFDRRDGVKDVDSYRTLREAMRMVGFTSKEQKEILSVACALLHMSNLEFVEYRADASALDKRNMSLEKVLTLMGVSYQALDDALCTCTISVGSEELKKNLTLEMACKATDGLVKATYEALFGYIVQKVNESITSRENLERIGDKRRTYSVKDSAVIGVLDIFGFESFDINSFEQLCINYCNEALQQQFNGFVFKLEQQEYEKEGIEWSFISFPDNQDVLDLIDKRHRGIFSILDEQCRLAKCTHLSFALATYEKCSSHSRFESDRRQKASGLFSINHYAGPVEYTCKSFLEKNKDEVPKEATDLLLSSTQPLLPRLGRILQNSRSFVFVSKDTNRALNRSDSSLSRASVASQFTAQLRELRERIDLTTPHYIRCLKPNDELIPNNFVPVIIADQLRCAGVLEAVRISRLGYPQRYSHDCFVLRYQMLGMKELNRARRTKQGNFCETLVNAVLPQILERQQMNLACDHNSTAFKKLKPSTSYDLVSIGIQVGKTKVFLRRQAFDALEQLRGHKLDTAASAIQAVCRTFVQREHYRWIILSIVKMQRSLRGYRARKRVRILKRNYASILIQRSWRKFIAYVNFSLALFVVEWCQRVHRGNVVRKRCSTLHIEQKAAIIQSIARMFFASNRFEIQKYIAINLQQLFRAKMARKILQQLRIDAKDFSRVAKERDDFRKEAERMRHELDEAKRQASENAEIAIEDARRQAAKEFKRTRKEAQRMAEGEVFRKRLSVVEVAKQIAEDSAEQRDCVTTPLTEVVTGNFDVLRKEVDRLNSELEILRAKKLPTVVYRDFPQHPSAQEQEILILSKACAQKDFELEMLRREIDALRADGQVDFDCKTSPADHARNRQSGSSPEPQGSTDNMSSTSSSVQFDPLSFSGFSDQMRNVPMLSPRSCSETEIRNFSTNSLSTASRSRKSCFKRARSKDSNLLDKISFTCEESFSSRGSLTTNICPADISRSRAVYFETPIHAAIRAADNEALSHAVSNSDEINGEINRGDQEGRTPLHLAVLGSNLLSVSFLLDHHSVPNAQDNDGNTPLHYAERHSMVKLLLESGGANPNIPNSVGVRALHLAVRRRDRLSVQCLIDHKAEVNEADDERWYTPLHIVAQPVYEPGNSQFAPLSTSAEIALILCEANIPSKADLNYQDKDGNTPLHHAAILDTSDAADLLSLFLRYGGDPNVANNRGQTPMHLLCHNLHLSEFGFYHDLLHLLLVNGADPNAPSRSGCTPLHLALYHQDVDASIQMLNSGAELHLPWKKPASWKPFWKANGGSDVYCLDMLEDGHSLHRVLSAISTEQKWAPVRPSCMHCKNHFGTFARQHHCRHCGSLVCGSCSPNKLEPIYFPRYCLTVHETQEASRVCSLCEQILITQKQERDIMGREVYAVYSNQEDVSFLDSVDVSELSPADSLLNKPPPWRSDF